MVFVCVAFMPIHLVFMSEKGFKMRLDGDQILLRIFQLFLEFILNFLELILFIRRLQNPFHELQIFYLDCSCINLSLRIFLKFWKLFEYFSCFKMISRLF